MRSSPRPQAPSLRDQLMVVERHEHLAQLAAIGDELSAMQYRQRELVARVLAEGATWADVAAATGISRRAARHRWPQAPSANASETSRAVHAAAIGAANGTGSPRAT